MRSLLEAHRRSGNVFPLIGGHRGCTCDFQENTIPAMNLGLERGADYLEIDVQLTKDHVPVIFHDIDTLDKTGLPGLVQDYTFGELNEKYRVPTLEEVMRWGRKNNVFFALEMKSSAYETEEMNYVLMPLMDEIVRAEGMLSQVEAFGVDYKVLASLKKIDKDFEIGLIVPFIPINPISLMREMSAMIYLSYVYNLTKEAVCDLQKHGYFVSGAILQTQKLVDYAISAKVDMFEYDYPERFVGYKR
ncbi:MAG: glycerophosphodiester phosphodiesterase [Sphaerochaetaceae bacterium]